MSPLCSPSPDGPGSDRWDRLGVWASIACTAHCMAAPFLFILAPGFAGIWAHPGSHALIATLVLPLAVTIIRKGYKLHGRRWIAGATGLGLHDPKPEQLALLAELPQLRALDIRNARRLAEGLAGVDGLEVDPGAVQTNMVFATVRDGDAAGFSRALREQDIIIPAVSPMRLVAHLDVETADIDRTIEAARDWFAGRVRRAS